MKEGTRLIGGSIPLEKFLPNDVPRGTIVTIQKFCELVFQYNQKMNLTGAKSPEDFFLHQVFDCVKAQEVLREENSWMDVGSGAGLPGIPWAILRKKGKFLLVEGSVKKAAFLQRAIDLLNLKNVEIIPQRVEEISIFDKNVSPDFFFNCVSRGTTSPKKLFLLISKIKFPWKQWLVFSSKKTHQVFLTEGKKFEMKVSELSYQRDLEDPTNRGLLTKIEKLIP
jgi:16S rRNA (guanine(527)-N(7))-methyltransferase RsmG